MPLGQIEKSFVQTHRLCQKTEKLEEKIAFLQSSIDKLATRVEIGRIKELTVVEAKGLFLPEFANTLSQLEINQSSLFDKTIIVFSQSIPTEKRVVKALVNSSLSKKRITLNQLKKLKELP